MTKRNDIKRGDIFFAEMPEPCTAQPHCCEIGRRPVVVVSSDIGNKTSRVMLVCPMTTKVKNISCNVNVTWTFDGRHSQVLCNHITTMPIECFEQRVGSLTREEMQAVNKGLLMCLGLKESAYVSKREHE